MKRIIMWHRPFFISFKYLYNKQSSSFNFTLTLSFNMPIEMCFKAVLYTIIKVHLTQIVRTMALANCRRCLNRTEPDEDHDCFRTRNRTVKYEKHYLIDHFSAAREAVMNLLLDPPFITDIKNLLYIHLYSHNYSTGLIHNYVTADRIRNTALSNEAMCKVFAHMWEFHQPTIPATCATDTTTTTTAVATSTATSSSGHQLTEHSPDDNDQN